MTFNPETLYPNTICPILRCRCRSGEEILRQTEIPMSGGDTQPSSTQLSWPEHLYASTDTAAGYLFALTTNIRT